ncbi:MAG: adenylate kinase [Clostridiaceae bacterium]|nr:adenylate kinase [Clostridiaceae bacterium]
MKIVLLGAPGAGKGTQAENLTCMLSIPHISTGDIFRENIRNGTKLGLEAKSYMDKGLLVPDELTVNIVKERLKKDDCKNGFLLDGFPRTISQAESLDAVLDSIGTKLDAVINLDVTDDVIVKRMAGRRICQNCGKSYHVVNHPPKVEGICDDCGSKLILRDDDKEETVLKRLREYKEKTLPLIDYYEKKGILFHFDGAKGIMETTDEIIAKLKAAGVGI